MNIYFLRHGQTDANIKDLYCGRTEANLTEKGIQQAVNAGKLLKTIDFSRVFVSERQRAADTLRYALGEETKYEIDPRVNEMDFGAFESKTYQELEKSYEKEFKLWGEDYKGYKLPEGESLLDLYKRFSEFMNELTSKDYENVLIVTHGGVMRCAYCYVLGSLDFYWKFGCRNGDIALIKYEYGNFYIDSITREWK